MCNLVNVNASDQRYLDLIHSPLFNPTANLSQWLSLPPSLASLQPRVSAFSRPLLPVLLPGISMDLASWTLLPSSVRTEQEAADFVRRYHTYNARSEDMAQRASYRASFEGGKRCVLPVLGFYEWQHLDAQGTPDPAGRKTLRHHIFRPDSQILYLGGLFSEWQGRRTFSVITTPSNHLMSRIHNAKQRQPLFVDHNELEEFLEADSIDRFCVPREDIELEALPDEPNKTPPADKPPRKNEGEQLELF